MAGKYQWQRKRRKRKVRDPSRSFDIARDNFSIILAVFVGLAAVVTMIVLALPLLNQWLSVLSGLFY